MFEIQVSTTYHTDGGVSFAVSETHQSRLRAMGRVGCASYYFGKVVLCMSTSLVVPGNTT